MLDVRGTDARAVCISSQATAHDAAALLQAMGQTTAGAPDPCDLVLALAKARRHDLFGLLKMQYPAFSFEQGMNSRGGDALVSLTGALRVGVGSGEYARLDPRTEQATGSAIMTHGLLSLDALLAIKDSDQVSMRPDVVRQGTGSRWIFGKPFNAGLTLGLLQGAINAGARPQDGRWNDLLSLAGRQALERCVETHDHQNPALDGLIEFILEQLRPDGDISIGQATAISVMKLHGMRNSEHADKWPRARQACNRMVLDARFCKKVANDYLQVRGWSRLGGQDIMDPGIFRRAGATPDAMAMLAAWAVRSKEKSLNKDTAGVLRECEWSHGERLLFTLRLVKEFEWMEKYWSDNIFETAIKPRALMGLLTCVHGNGPAVDTMASMITSRAHTPMGDREDIEAFDEKLHAAFSMLQMDEHTQQTRGGKHAAPRL